MTVLVTGGTGFLGGRVVERLVLEKHSQVRVLLRSVGKASRIASLPVQYYLGDAADPDAFRKAAEGCDVVIHCASLIDATASKLTSTYLGTKTAAQVCAELGIRLVHVSSSAVYGNPTTSVVDEKTPHRPRHKRDIYAQAKIAAEQAVASHCANSSLRAAIIQPTMIYGPHSGEWTLAPLAMLSSANIVMPEDDNSICNAVYVDDVVNAILLSINACNPSCPAYIINGNTLPTWSDFLSRHTALGAPGSIIPTSTGEIKRLKNESSKQRSLIRTSVKLLREPLFRSALLGTTIVGGIFSLFQKVASKNRFESIKRRLTGRSVNGLPIVEFSKPDELPLHLPPVHFLELAKQHYRFSNAKAQQELAYEPAYSLDSAFEIIEAWAKWSRLVP